MNTHDSRSTTKLTGARPSAAEATHAQSPDHAEAVSAFPSPGQPVQQARLLALQRIAGNAAVARMVQRSGAPRIQRDTPPGANTPMQRARAALDAMSQDRMGEAAAMISGAAARAGQASSLITLTLPGNVTIDQFPTDQLTRLLEYANTIAIRAPADPASERLFRRIQREAEARIANERVEQFLRDAENPQPGTGPNANTFLVHDRNGQIQHLTQEQLTQWRDRLTAEITRQIGRAQANLGAAQDVRQHFAGTRNGRWNPQSSQEESDLMFGGADLTLAQSAIAQRRYAEAYHAVITAVAQGQRARQAVVGGLQDTASAQQNLVYMRFARDLGVAILGTLVTAATGGGAGAVLLGAAVGATGTAVSEAEDQYYETDRVNWNGVVWNGVFNTLFGFLGGVGGGALAEVISAPLKEELIRRGISTASQHFINERIVPTIINGIMARANAAAGAAASGRAQNATVGNFTPADPRQQITSQYQRLTPQQVDALAADQVGIRNIVIETLNQYRAAMLSEALRAAAGSR